MCFFRLLVCLMVKNMKNAEKDDIDVILKAVMQWQNERFPDYELVILSLPQYNREARERNIVHMADMLRKYGYISGDY